MSDQLNESPYIFGIHEPGGEDHMVQAGKKGWIVFTEAIGADPNDHTGRSYTAYSDQGLGIICRLNNGYKPGGTIPFSNQYENFAKRAANFAANSAGCHIWIIGNEMNFWVERPGADDARGLVPATRDTDPETVDGLLRDLPDRFGALHPDQPLSRGAASGEVITPERYVRCYRLCRTAIHQKAGHEHDQVLVGAVAPWNNNTQYPGNENGDWIQYFREILSQLGPQSCDGITIHTYTHGTEPGLIHDETKMEAPFQDHHYHFLAYRDFMNAIPGNMRHLPVFLTETDEDDPWENANRGWVKRAYGEINWWNQQPGHQQIRAMILYRWPDKDKWVIEGKGNVEQDFREALQNDYRWRRDVTPSAPEQPSETVTPPQPLPAADYSAGDRIYTARVVNLRRTPGFVDKAADDVLAEIEGGRPLTVVGGPQTVDNLVWWNVRYTPPGQTALQGWAAQAVSAEVALLTDTPPATTTPPAFAPGDQVYFLATVRLLRAPGVSDTSAGDILAEVPTDARATVLAGPQQADGLVWWRLRCNLAGGQVEGWVAQTTDEGSTLLAKATTGETTDEESEQPETEISGKFKSGDTVYATAYVNIRQTPGYVNKGEEDVVEEIPYGGHAAIEAGPQQADGLVWWRVAYTTAERTGVEGWVAETTSDGQELLSQDEPPPPKPVQPSPTDTFEKGALVTNISLADVNVRRTAGYRNKAADDVKAVASSKTLMKIQGGPEKIDGLYWWQVTGVAANSDIDGWMAETSPNGVRLLAPALYRDLIDLGIPFAGEHPVTQLWGDNPDFYSQFTYDGVPLRGHNGIDFGMPVGTNLLATDSGTIQTVGFFKGGFGNWVMVGHRWGHSVYAHMDRVIVREGQSVERGQVLGQSGNTGNSTGPHLHFSIRITPSHRDDGWGGYSDPMPYMDQSELIIPAHVRGEAEGERMAPTPLPAEVPGRPLP